MKILQDFLPLGLFFAAYKLGDIYWATGIAMAATAILVAWHLFRGQKVEPLLWFNFVIIIGFGGLTLWLHDNRFILWKPTVLYGLFAVLLLGGQAFGKNFIKTLLEKQLQLPDLVWTRLLYAWAGCFAVLAALNLYVAYNFSESTWATFKVFGLTALLLIFSVGQVFMIAKYLPDDNKLPEPTSKDD
jgi:intracellular septation protein